MIFPLHAAAQRGHEDGLLRLLTTRPDEVDSYDRLGYTPLMYAVLSETAGLETLGLLLKHGADPNRVRRDDVQGTGMSLAVSLGNIEKVQVLVEHRGDLHYLRESGYDAFIDAVTNGRIPEEQTIEMLRYLVDKEVKFDGMSEYGESAVRVLSRQGRFKALAFLLDVGASGDSLKWNPLQEAIARGRRIEVEALLAEGASAQLEEKDYWGRTSWLLAIHTGDIGITELLMDWGADAQARGRCGRPPLFYAIERRHTAMLDWLLAQGFLPDATDDFGATALIHAVEEENPAAVDALLRAGADIGARYHDQTALALARDARIIRVLLDAGASAVELEQEGRRALVGFSPDPDIYALDCSPGEFADGRVPVFGKANPERSESLFRMAMVRAGVSAWAAMDWFRDHVKEEVHPVWCARRFGQSLTFLPDGRIIQIGGEHEDYYDPDFCIYNDVFLHGPDGEIQIFMYPRDVFPPTDFHSTTLVGEHIYIIGSLGYSGERDPSHTPVYRLNIETMEIEKVPTAGKSPGWIHGHTARLRGEDNILVEGGKITTICSGQEELVENDRSFILNLRSGEWRDCVPASLC